MLGMIIRKCAVVKFRFVTGGPMELPHLAFIWMDPYLTLLVVQEVAAVASVTVYLFFLLSLKEELMFNFNPAHQHAYIRLL